MNRPDDHRRQARGAASRPDKSRHTGQRGAARPEESRRTGQRTAARPDAQQRAARPAEPPLAEHITADQVDRSVHRELRTLSKDNAEGVARHLVAVAEALAAEEFELALAHAQTATRRAGRVAIVRETLGVVHYRREEWAKALSEFRTARRLSGSEHLLPLIADTERGLGRPERAIELAAGPEAGRLDAADRVELALVVSGARRDLGQTRAAVHSLRDLVRGCLPAAPWAGRLYYAYADALLADGLDQEARTWLQRAADADPERQTDAAERLGDSVGDLIDLDEVEPGPTEPVVAQKATEPQPHRHR